MTNGAWRAYLEKLLVTNGYVFTNLGRWASTPAPGFTQVHHEGMDGAVIAAPGLSGPTHGYAVASNYALLTVADALTTLSNTVPDLVLIDLGVNDMGQGRDPKHVATNDLPALLDLIFATAPAAHIIVSKPTTISSSPHSFIFHPQDQHADFLRRRSSAGRRPDARPGPECVRGGSVLRRQWQHHVEQ